MCTCVYRCYAHMYACMYAHAHTDIYECTRQVCTDVWVYDYMYTHAQTHVYEYVCVYAFYTYTGMHTLRCVCVSMCVYRAHHNFLKTNSPAARYLGHAHSLHADSLAQARSPVTRRSRRVLVAELVFGVQPSSFLQICRIRCTKEAAHPRFHPLTDTCEAM